MQDTIARWIRIVGIIVLVGSIGLFQTSLHAQDGPVLEVTPEKLQFQAESGETPEPQTLTIVNKGGGQMDWETTDDADWLISESSGVLAGGQSTEINVIALIENLDGGKHRATITVRTEGAKGSPVDIPVTLDLVARPNCARGGSLDPALATWLSAKPISALFTALLTEIGYNVNDPERFNSTSTFYQALAEGEVDFWPNGWFPLHEPKLPGGREEFEASATLFEPYCDNCALQGYLVNTAAIQQYDITSLEDFERFDVQRAFDANDDGRADLYGCPEGWACHQSVDAHLDMYGLRSAINHRTSGGYFSNFREAEQRIENGRPTLLYTWTPSRQMSRLDLGTEVKWINLVDDRDDLERTSTQEAYDRDALIAEGLGADAVTDPTILGFTVNDIRVVANREFLQANHVAEALFRQVRLSMSWISRATAAIEDEGTDPERTAADWMETHRQTVNEWFTRACQ